MKQVALLILMFALQFAPVHAQVKFTGRILGCQPGVKIYIYELNGLAVKPIAEGVPGETADTYQFTLPNGTPKIYGLGLDQENVKQIILGAESGFTVWGNCEKMPYARTIGSEANKELEAILKEIKANDEAYAKYRAEYITANGLQQDVAPWLAKIAEVDAAKKANLENARKKGGVLALIAGLQTQFSFEKHNNGKENEGGYLARTFFQEVNLSDKKLDEVPYVFNAFKVFTEEYGKTAAPNEQFKQLINTTLGKIPAGSPAYRSAFGGVISGLKTLNSPLFFDYAKEYIAKYTATDQGEVSKLDYDLNRNRTFIPGMEAPDLVGPTPEGNSYSLKEMRGKVVLIDFWASWCGPCRRENPNVKASYEKYKDKGFDVLGVSLDKTKEAWTGAIQQDGLPWHHISDLKGWQSEHAAMYSVSSIPQTLLIDRDGKIIERNLRGPALDEKLKQIFGQ